MIFKYLRPPLLAWSIPFMIGVDSQWGFWWATFIAVIYTIGAVVMIMNALGRDPYY